ncbi:MAG TPA: cyclase family protein [Longimicrobiales bacterium]|nr:cyclase family protein [Longimicrobiales bacterium]
MRSAAAPHAQGTGEPRRRTARATAAAAATVLALLLPLPAWAQADDRAGAAALVDRTAADLGPLTAADIDRLMGEVSNWGRWGPQDQLGTLNLITADKRRWAAALVEDGVAVSLSHDMVRESTTEMGGPMGLEVVVLGDTTGFGGAVDAYTGHYHGYYYAHLDGLAHIAWKGKLYNGNPAAEITEDGAPKLGTEVMKHGMFTRGVLIDLPRFRGVPWLEPGTAVTTGELEAWERWSGVEIEPGDVLLVRTGRWAARQERGPWQARRLLAGLHASTAPWLHARGIAAVGLDGVTDVLPSGVEGVGQPLHVLAIVGMGMPLFDNLHLERLAEEAAARGRHTFLFSVAPIRVPGGFGAPVNPLAIF